MAEPSNDKTKSQRLIRYWHAARIFDVTKSIKMARKSAGIMMYRYTNGKLEVLLVHPGGPFWQNKDDGAWSIPKGEFTEEEDALVAARREFKEETGFDAAGPFAPLSPVFQNRSKQVFAWACEGNIDADKIESNTMFTEWPPKSGKQIRIPEVDRAEWCDVATARRKLLKGQVPLIDELVEVLKPR
jgi:predicted NUDIX family NTP pyrophosphohydrolase